MKPNKNTIKILALASICSLALSACNTVEGVGKDVKAAGGAVEDTADENNTYDNH